MILNRLECYPRFMVIVPLEAIAKFIGSLCVVFECLAPSDIERVFFHMLCLSR